MRNGVKEDILLERAPADTISYSWRIKHKNDLQPRLLPDGSVGLYSADPALYGNLQIADEESQKLIDSARQKGDKTHLAFVLPAPYIKGLDGKKQYEEVIYP
jgi:hypothetical protein